MKILVSKTMNTKDLVDVFIYQFRNMRGNYGVVLPPSKRAISDMAYNNIIRYLEQIEFID